MARASWISRLTGNHLCDRKNCSVWLDKYHPHCPAHAVHVIRRNSRKDDYCSIYDVKIGDRIVL